MTTAQALTLARSWQQLQNRTATSATAESRRLWRAVDRSNIVASWSLLVPRMLAVVMAGQLIAGRSAEDYVNSVLAAQEIDPDAEFRFVPDSLMGLSADGEDLEHALMWPAWAALAALSAGATQATAMATGALALDLTAPTQIQDAFRVSAGVATAPKMAATQYSRALTPPSCSRCIVLAGDSSWSTAFRRHPRCDCTTIPTNEIGAEDITTYPKDFFDSLSREDQDKVFGRAGAEAIRDGADLNKVVNDRRKAAGLSSAAEDQLGKIREQGILDQVRGLDGDPLITFSRQSGQNRRDKRVRVMPETIYKVARDREHAIELLKANGFIAEDFRDRLMRVRGFV